MTALESRLMERLKVLPHERVAEVVDFVEFLASRVQQGEAARRLGDAMARLDALNLPAMTEEEIEDEVQACRSGWRSNPTSSVTDVATGLWDLR